MTVVGTRPEIIRLSRVMAALDRSLDRKITTDDGQTKSEHGAAMWW